MTGSPSLTWKPGKDHRQSPLVVRLSISDHPLEVELQSAGLECICPTHSGAGSCGGTFQRWSSVDGGCVLEWAGLTGLSSYESGLVWGEAPAFPGLSTHSQLPPCCDAAKGPY